MRIASQTNGDSGQKSDSNSEPDAGHDSPGPSFAMEVSSDPYFKPEAVCKFLKKMSLAMRSVEVGLR